MRHETDLPTFNKAGDVVVWYEASSAQLPRRHDKNQVNSNIQMVFLLTCFALIFKYFTVTSKNVEF